MALEIKYSSDQEHQVEAVDAVCDLFRGQEFMDSDFVAEMGTGILEGQVTQVGHANGLRLSATQLAPYISGCFGDVPRHPLR